jgi:hypothetical protein
MKRTNAQRQRQDIEFRDKGKYSKVNPCYACDKSAGVNYNSHPLTDTGDWNDLALCLCLKCWNATKDMVDVSEFLRYKQSKETK